MLERGTCTHTHTHTRLHCGVCVSLPPLSVHAPKMHSKPGKVMLIHMNWKLVPHKLIPSKSTSVVSRAYNVTVTLLPLITPPTTHTHFASYTSWLLHDLLIAHDQPGNNIVIFASILKVELWHSIMTWMAVFLLWWSYLYSLSTLIFCIMMFVMDHGLKQYYAHMHLY